MFSHVVTGFCPQGSKDQCDFFPFFFMVLFKRQLLYILLWGNSINHCGKLYLLCVVVMIDCCFAVKYLLCIFILYASLGDLCHRTEVFMELTHIFYFLCFFNSTVHFSLIFVLQCLVFPSVLWFSTEVTHIHFSYVQLITHSFFCHAVLIFYKNTAM